MNAVHRYLARARLFVLASFAAALLAGCGGSDDAHMSVAGTDSRAKALAVDPAAGLAVVSLIKVSERRVSRTVFDYVFKITVQNDAQARTDVIAKLNGAGPGTTVMYGTVSVGDLAPGQRASPTDTITLRQDRTFAFDLSALKWLIASSGTLADAQLSAVAIGGAADGNVYGIAGLDLSVPVQLLGLADVASSLHFDVSLTAGNARVDRSGSDWTLSINRSDLPGLYAVSCGMQQVIPRRLQRSDAAPRRRTARPADA